MLNKIWSWAAEKESQIHKNMSASKNFRIKNTTQEILWTLCVTYYFGHMPICSTWRCVVTKRTYPICTPPQRKKGARSSENNSRTGCKGVQMLPVVVDVLLFKEPDLNASRWHICRAFLFIHLFIYFCHELLTTCHCFQLQSSLFHSWIENNAKTVPHVFQFCPLSLLFWNVLIVECKNQQ